MEETIFTKIVKGEIPCHKVHEDDKTLAFLDIHPIQPGQVLVIPKQQVEHVWDLDDETYIDVMKSAKAVAQRLRLVFPDKSHIALVIEGLEVAHAHLKLFPFTTTEEFNHKPDINLEPNHSELASLAKKLMF